ncbi:CYTH and CHAD domain-containing protein [Streptomyces sp. NPDC001941]|uniref:CYTH and CHAD domain-containing protein n=1 Tax=Streptomyces sp. NPDC001941 TaxID=3154659 RepID=UPI00331FB864
MADTKREIELKYEATADTELPDLTRVTDVASVADRGVAELDAVYHDTRGLRLASDALTLRRRTGGDDAGWHLKFPVSTGIRDEIRAPLAPTLPRPLAALIRSRVRGEEVVPVMRLLSTRAVHHLLAADGTLLAEVSVDTVRAENLLADGRADWRELEVELADGADPALLAAVGKRLRKAGVRPSASPSKLARALTETGLRPTRPAPGGDPAPGTAGAHVLDYLRAQRDALVALDPAVRRDLPDSVHQMRVATRRMRSAFKTYRRVLDRTATDPVGGELRWLAAELGAARDHEVLLDRLRTRVDALPRTLLLGPVRGRLRIWNAARGSGSRRRALSTLDGPRYLALLEALDALLQAPPLLPAAARPPEKALAAAVRRNHDRLAARVGRALELPPGHERDLAAHDARKAAKRARYAGEAATAALGKPAKRFARAMKEVQTVLGDHQDAVVAREALRALAVQAHLAGESAFTWGLLYGQEEAAAAAREAELPAVWARASEPGLREALGS